MARRRASRWMPVLAVAVLVALAASGANGQSTSASPGPEIVVLVHHPYPDDADPLGFPFEAGHDAFRARHGNQPIFRDGIAFPGFIVDSLHAMEGLPEGDPQEATHAAYAQLIERRLAEPAPVAIEVETRVADDEVRFRIAREGELAGHATWWVALVEHPVHYQPPAALSNGVFDHPFTVRNITDTGQTQAALTMTIAMPQGVEPARTWLAAWLQRDAEPLAGTPGEVVQAAFHPVLSTDVTRQVGRAVLVEAYSASWCDPCLFGDRAIEALAAQHGVPTATPRPDEATYWRSPAGWVWPAVAAAALAVALVRLPGGRP